MDGATGGRKDRGMAEQTTAPVKAGDGRVSRRDPSELLDTLQHDLERMWDDFPAFGPWPIFRPFRRAGAREAAWAPRLDVYEEADTLIVKADLPGIKKEDLEVSLEQDRLIIRGERREEREVKEERYYRLERNVGSFYRALPLPFAVKPEQIAATYRDGILDIRIPKPAEQKTAQKIAVQ